MKGDFEIFQDAHGNIYSCRTDPLDSSMSEDIILKAFLAFIFGCMLFGFIFNIEINKPDVVAKPYEYIRNRNNKEIKNKIKRTKTNIDIKKVTGNVNCNNCTVNINVVSGDVNVRK